MTDIRHDHLGQRARRQCGGFDKISPELSTAWDRANTEWQERRRAGLDVRIARVQLLEQVDTES